MHGAPLEAGLGVAIFQAEAGSASTLCVIPRLGTALRIPGLLSGRLLVPLADMISVVTTQEGLGTSLWPCPTKLCMHQTWVS